MLTNVNQSWGRVKMPLGMLPWDISLYIKEAGILPPQRGTYYLHIIIFSTCIFKATCALYFPLLKFGYFRCNINVTFVNYSVLIYHIHYMKDMFIFKF